MGQGWSKICCNGSKSPSPPETPRCIPDKSVPHQTIGNEWQSTTPTCPKTMLERQGVSCDVSKLETINIEVEIQVKDKSGRCTTNLEKNLQVTAEGESKEPEAKDNADKVILSGSFSCVNINAGLGSVEYGDYLLDELIVIATLGVGSFGRVELVQSTRDKTKTFALKCMKKQHIVDMNQQDHVLSEKAVLLQCCSPFICRLYRTYKDSKCVYLLMEACLGGEVWTHLRDQGCFNNTTTQFIVGCVVEALSYLHALGIIYRDLKSENLLLTESGYVKLVDFGFSKQLGHSTQTFTFCGTPDYMAPEIILYEGHDRAVDYWSLGVLMFELLTGTLPFVSADRMTTYNNVQKGIDRVIFPSHVSENARSLIKRLCRKIPSERLGCQGGGLEEVRNDRWFEGFYWTSLRSQTMPVPILPQVKGPTDTGNFDEFPKDMDPTPDECSNWDADF